MPKKTKKGKSLGGLADALVHAGVAKESQARRAQHERAAQERKMTPAERERLDEEKRERQSAERAEKAEADRQREATRVNEQQRERNEQAILAKREPVGGPRRWFFVAADGRVPYLDVTERQQRALADGDAGIVDCAGCGGDEHAVVVDRDLLRRLLDSEPERVRAWNGADS
ncbi:MAG: DUF2058 family protein [Acidobacteriota bacterium]